MKVKSKKNRKQFKLLLFSLAMVFALLLFFSLLNPGKYEDKRNEYNALIEKYAAMNELDSNLVKLTACSSTRTS